MKKKDLIELHEFLECDMPTKIFPEEIIKGETFVRTDHFKNKREVEEYLKEHFRIAFPEIFVKE